MIVGTADLRRLEEKVRGKLYFSISENPVLAYDTSHDLVSLLPKGGRAEMTGQGLRMYTSVGRKFKIYVLHNTVSLTQQQRFLNSLKADTDYWHTQRNKIIRGMGEEVRALMRLQKL